MYTFLLIINSGLQEENNTPPLLFVVVYSSNRIGSSLIAIKKKTNELREKERNTTLTISTISTILLNKQVCFSFEQKNKKDIDRQIQKEINLIIIIIVREVLQEEVIFIFTIQETYFKTITKHIRFLLTLWKKREKKATLRFKSPSFYNFPLKNELT